MKIFKRLIASAAMAVCLFAGTAMAANPGQFQNPQPSTTTGLAIMWVAGNIEIHKSSSDPTSMIILSSTGGARFTYGIVTTTEVITGLLTGFQANFSSWITASSGTFQSSMTASLVNFSSAIINGLSFTFQATRGSAGQYLTEDGKGNLTWTSPASGGVTTKNYDGIVVGTQAAVGVDAIVTTAQQFTLVLASFNAAGLTYSATGYGTIYFRNGLYPIVGSTVPAGINLVCESSVSFNMGTVTAQTLIVNYGTVGDPRGSPCIIDGAGTAVNAQAYVAKAWSVNNLNFTGFQNQGANSSFAAGDQRCVFCVVTSSFTRGNLWFMPNGFKANASNTASNKGGQATMAIIDSLNSQYNVRTSTWIPGTDTGPVGRVFLTMKSTTGTVVKFESEAAGNNWIHLTKDNRRPTISGNFNLRSEGTSAESDSAFIAFDYQGGSYASSGTYIGPMNLRVLTGVTYDLIKFGSNGASFRNFNPTVQYVNVACEDPNNNVTVLRTGNDSTSAVIDQLFIIGCQIGVVDSGAVTKYNYYKDGVKNTQ